MRTRCFPRYGLYLFLLAVCTSVLSGCADDIQDYDDLPPLTREECPNKWCDKSEEERAVDIEHRKNEKLRRRYHLKKYKPVPGLYQPFNQSATTF